MTLKYCGGDARQAESVVGWGRHTVELGLAERRTGILCLGAQSACSGRKRWEDEHPQVVEALWQLAESPAQQALTFRTSLTYTRLPAQGALKVWRAHERCWGILELHWNGAKLIDVETMLEWAKSMTWKGMQPMVELSRQVYHKGISLGKRTRCEIDKRLERHSQLPKGDILIRPASTL